MSLLTYSMYMLVEHPEIERRLRQEIFEVVGPSVRPTQENIRNMKFMRAFLNGDILCDSWVTLFTDGSDYF